MPDWKINLVTAPITDGISWDAETAGASILEWASGEAGIDPEKARQGFLLTDEHATGRAEGYKLPYCVVVDGQLFAVASVLASCMSELAGMFGSSGEASGASSAGDTGSNGTNPPAGQGLSSEAAQGSERGIPAEVRNVDTAVAPAEFKTGPGFAKVEGDRTVVGFPTIYGNVDDGGDLIKPGAYAKTIAERSSRFRWLWQHDWQSPPTATIEAIESVGRADLPFEVLQRFPEAEGGLRVRRRYLMTQRGDEILQGIASGAITEMSIGYDTISQERPEEMIVGGRKVERILREIRLWEMSDVLWGMNPATANAKSFWDKVALNYPDDALYALLAQTGRLDALFAKFRAATPGDGRNSGQAGRDLDVKVEALRREQRLRLAAAKLRVIG